MTETLRLRRASATDLGEVLAIDDDATRLYGEAGLAVALPPTHPFVVAEVARWSEAIRFGSLLLAIDGERAIGFAAIGSVDDAPYLDQLSVRMESMRRGVGSWLLRHAIRAVEAQQQPLWLTTYDHLPWNRPFYERAGFATVPEATVGAGIRALLAEQRRFLPAPQHRVAMSRPVQSIRAGERQPGERRPR